MGQMEHALLYNFLEASSDCNFKDQLLFVPVSQGPGWGTPFKQGGLNRRIVAQSASDDDSELQCDGNRSGHLQNGELGFDAQLNEDVVRVIAAQLAEIGDQLDKEIQARVVTDLVQHFQNENLSREVIIQHMSAIVRELVRAIPSDMEQEKAMLVLAMLLTKKIVNKVPSLFHRVISTTVTFMNQHFHNYIAEMLHE